MSCQSGRNPNRLLRKPEHRHEFLSLLLFHGRNGVATPEGVLTRRSTVDVQRAIPDGAWVREGVGGAVPSSSSRSLSKWISLCLNPISLFFSAYATECPPRLLAILSSARTSYTAATAAFSYASSELRLVVFAKRAIIAVGRASFTSFFFCLFWPFRLGASFG